MPLDRRIAAPHRLAEQAAQQRMIVRGFDRLLTVQRPVVLATLRDLRRRHPSASPDETIRMLERRYLAAVTVGGAGVGASAAVPGVGTAVGIALTGVETAVFLESSALFAQAVTEVHGIAVTDPDRARALVMTMMLGDSGADLVRQLAAQFAGNGMPQTAFWGDIIGKSLPKAFTGQLADQVKRQFMRRFAANTSSGAVARLLPFGVGAVIGGSAAHLLGRKVVTSSRTAFGPAPQLFPDNLAAIVPPRRAVRTAFKTAAATTVEAGQRAAAGTASAAKRAASSTAKAGRTVGNGLARPVRRSRRTSVAESASEATQDSSTGASSSSASSSSNAPTSAS
ncbi:hypothetical protein [Ruicaihuangia caeni]|uniref:DUF697 domain-containing protein n=1 Tax=Ruicaihuangia caeni TaxID=3042517 RepID=A0AAW6T380_9MICO|nr:hypothetical protein [Klugiella sp. YN-L-19]MDI2097561.1 hypothetical protein [Klugiella sp. YN-L-19]